MKPILLIIGIVLLVVGMASATQYVELNYHAEQQTNHISVMTPDVGKTFLLVNIAITNYGYEDVFTNPNYFYVEVNNVRYGYDSASFLLKDLSMPILDTNAHLADGGQISGYLVFQVPADAKRLTLIYDDGSYPAKEVRYNQ